MSAMYPSPEYRIDELQKKVAHLERELKRGKMQGVVVDTTGEIVCSVEEYTRITTEWAERGERIAADARAIEALTRVAKRAAGASCFDPCNCRKRPNCTSCIARAALAMIEQRP